MPPMRMGKNFGKEKAKKGTLLRLLKTLFKDFKVQIILVMVCLLINIGTNLCSSIFVGLVTDTISDGLKNGLPHNDILAKVTKQLAILGVIYVFGLLTSFGWNYTMGITTQKFLNKIRKSIFDHMETLPIRYFDTHAHGDIMSIYTNDIDTIRQLVSQSLPALYQTVLTAIGAFMVMLFKSLWLTLIVIFGAIFMFLTTKGIGGKSAKFFVKQQMELGKVEGNIEESMTGLKVIKVFCHEDQSINEFEKMNEELCNVATTANSNSNIMGPIMGNIGNFLYLLVACAAGILIILSGAGKNINLSLLGWTVPDYGLLVMFCMLARMFTNNVNQFAQQIGFVVMGLAGASRCFDLLDEQPEADNGYVTLVNIKYNEDGTFEETNERTRFYAWKHPHHNGELTYTELKGDIVLKEVDFGYVPEKIVLEDVSIYAHPGQKIAFVGATGAGKTTITNLINRFYDIADGKIRYDGININKIKKADLRRSLGIVLQDTNLFTGTVMDNIRYGRLDATDEEVYQAAKIANAYDFIMRLPQGFNTMIDGDGSSLSQGQRQLLSIARAAVADAPVMILDEATSSIDTRTEKIVQQGTDQLMQGRTVFVIAHRLSTVQNANAIMVLDHGHIIERGDHNELINAKGVYYQLYTGAFELE